MALGTPVAAAAAYSAASGTTVAPAYPAGILATDEVVMFVGMKPTAVAGGTVTTPTGWTLRDSLTNAGGYAAQGADTGNSNLYVYTWDTPVAGQTGNLTVTIGGNNISWAFIARVPTGGGAPAFGSADGQRTTTPTSPMSIALTNGATPTNFQTGDLAIWAMCIPTDVTTPAQFSAQSITATGATFGAAVEINEPDSTLGNDIGGYSAYASVTAGSSTTAPTVVATLAGTLTNVRGPVVLLRLREGALAPITGTFAATETGADALAATGDVLVEGAGAASETGSDTLAATGSVAAAAITGTFAATETGADTLAATGDVIVKGAFAASETAKDTLAATGDVFVKGAFAANETGADTLAATGDVFVKGAFAASETAKDTLAATGIVFTPGTTGIFAAAEVGSDTLAGTGRVIVTGAFAATEVGSDSLAATGDVFIKGSIVLVETGADLLATTGSVKVSGSGAAAEVGSDIFAGNGGAQAIGTFAATETGADSLAAAGQIRVTGVFSAAETGADLLAATGTVSTGGIYGNFAATEGADIFGGYFAPGYVDDGYVDTGVTGTVTGGQVMSSGGRRMRHRELDWVDWPTFGPEEARKLRRKREEVLLLLS